MLESNGSQKTSAPGKAIYGPVDLNHIDALAGAALGPYHILQLVRETPASILYLAFDADNPFNSSVALKIIKPHLDTAYIAKQFEADRAALRQLQHPHIARLFGGGVTREGLLYFASEFVSGRPIDEYCDAGRLSIYGRLQLFSDLCDSVSYAHGNLITHGLLHADHVFVTADGTVRLLDAGVARFIKLDAQPNTKNATADLHALGALLYELLCGLKPEHQSEITPPSMALADLHSQTETINTISEARDTSARQLQRRLSGELDLICLRCLHPDPAHRYRSVEALYADIQRYLSGYPVEACPDHLSYRAKKFIMRNLIGVTLAGTGMCLLLALVVYYGLRLI